MTPRQTVLAGPSVAKRKDTTDERLAVTLTVAELTEAIQLAVLEALAEHERDRTPAPELVATGELARRLSCSRMSIHRLCREGMPHVHIGDVRRFRLAEVLRWLEQRATDGEVRRDAK